ncbi:hypothetical protein BDN72DRAFT_651165 [Pluteus cervinus]|uniref:Uncharacterized protein n=1 Tax=Pluteus cervinus TaxID=181527 RepID=A0ACD3ASJ9_9AGAR|nr:hypothetical protein BDN72DRAFT_651165 [Pluteus cervinus]
MAASKLLDSERRGITFVSHLPRMEVEPGRARVHGKIIILSKTQKAIRGEKNGHKWRLIAAWKVLFMLPWLDEIREQVLIIWVILRRTKKTGTRKRWSERCHEGGGWHCDDRCKLHIYSRSTEPSGLCWILPDEATLSSERRQNAVSPQTSCSFSGYIRDKNFDEIKRKWNTPTDKHVKWECTWTLIAGNIVYSCYEN